MIKSSITAKYQVTVPKLVRQHLGVGTGDVLQWEVQDGAVRVSPANTAFLALRGSIRVGRGSVVHDVARARQKRGITRG